MEIKFHKYLIKDYYLKHKNALYDFEIVSLIPYDYLTIALEFINMQEKAYFYVVFMNTVHIV